MPFRLPDEVPRPFNCACPGRQVLNGATRTAALAFRVVCHPELTEGYKLLTKTWPNMGKNVIMMA